MVPVWRTQWHNASPTSLHIILALTYCFSVGAANFCTFHITHLIWPHFMWSECAVLWAVAATNHTRQHNLLSADWLQPHTQFRLNEVRWDEMRWGEWYERFLKIGPINACPGRKSYTAMKPGFRFLCLFHVSGIFRFIGACIFLLC